MRKATKPAQFKALGRKVKGFDEKKWNKSDDSPICLVYFVRN